MKFYKVDSVTPVARYVSREIMMHLAAGERVLWLLAGGSAIKLAVEVARRLRSSPDITKLTVTLADERYGPAGHKDSNWQQILNAGFSLPGATLKPILSGGTLDESAKAYAAELTDDLNRADYSLALAGIGPDGHTFGIKPGSASVSSREPVIGYKWTDYIRLTPTINLLSQIDEVIVYAAGEEKHLQLDNLDEDLSINQQPAQLLKKLSKVIIFNDYKGESYEINN